MLYWVLLARATRLTHLPGARDAKLELLYFKQVFDCETIYNY